MDEMRIVSEFTRGLVSKIARRIVKRKTGYIVDIQFNKIETTVINGKTHVRLDLDAELEKDELMKILKSVGLD